VGPGWGGSGQGKRRRRDRVGPRISSAWASVPGAERAIYQSYSRAPTSTTALVAKICGTSKRSSGSVKARPVLLDEGGGTGFRMR
jgi:hypothetical protein